MKYIPKKKADRYALTKQDKIKVGIIFFLLIGVPLLYSVTTAYYSGKERLQKFKSLTLNDIDKIEICWENGSVVRYEISNRNEIEKFIDFAQDAKRFVPNHDMGGGKDWCTKVYLSNNEMIRLLFSSNTSHPNTVVGQFTEIQYSTNNRKRIVRQNYFISSDLFLWFKKYIKFADWHRD